MQNEKENIVFVIGNGFCMDLGKKTSYYDYAKHFVNDYNNGVYKNINSQLKGLIYTHASKQIQPNNNQDSYWFDLEQVIIDFTKTTPVSKINIADETEFLNRIKFDLWGFISVQMKSNVTNTDSLAYLLSEKVSTQKHVSKVISFNYVDVGYIYPDEGLDELLNRNAHVCHIHLNTDNGGDLRNSIVLGSNLYDGIDPVFTPFVKFYQRRSPEPISEYLQNATSIVFFGLSFGESDSDYFKNFFDGTHGKKIFIVTKDDNGVIGIRTRIREMVGNESALRFLNSNSVEFVTTDSYGRLSKGYTLLLQLFEYGEQIFL